MSLVKDYQRRAMTGGNSQRRSITITTAQILALNATPIIVIPKPKTGQMLVLESVHLFLDYAGVAYAGIAAGEDLAFSYQADVSGQEILQVESTGFLDATADASRYAMVTALITPEVDQPIALEILVGEIITGTSPLLLNLYYRTIREQLL